MSVPVKFKSAEPAVFHARMWLALAFLLPNLGALGCGFVLDDITEIVTNPALHVHSLYQVAHIWAESYWPGGAFQLYRPVSQTLWAILWSVSEGLNSGQAILFHAVGLALGLTVVLLFYRFLIAVQASPRIAFIAAALFALFPIHTEATTSVVGSAELLAAAFGLGSMLCYYRHRPITALILFALAVFSKESAAAFAALPLVFPRKDWRDRDSLFAACGAVGVIAAALVLHHAIAGPSQSISWGDNSIVLVQGVPRILTALWVQCLYLSKTLVPITLSADYTFNQIPLVMGFGDWRAWAAMTLIGGAFFLAIRYRQFRAPILAYAILFSPTANILFPIGTLMGERLAYAPSLAFALFSALLLAQCRHWKIILVTVALIFSVRTAVRNLDWLDWQAICSKTAETSPKSVKVNTYVGAMRWASGDYLGAVEAYDHAIEVLPSYARPYCARGMVLANVGRRSDALADFETCMRLDGYRFPMPSAVREYVEQKNQFPHRYFRP